MHHYLTNLQLAEPHWVVFCHSDLLPSHSSLTLSLKGSPKDSRDSVAAEHFHPGSYFFLVHTLLSPITAHPSVPKRTLSYLSVMSLIFLFHTGSSTQVLQQTPISITKPESETVLIRCHISDPDFSNVFIHWCQKSPSTDPKRIGVLQAIP